MEDLKMRRIIVIILLCFIILFFIGMISTTIFIFVFPDLIGTAEAAELATLFAYQQAAGVPIISAITMLMCPAVILIVLNTTGIKFRIRILICRIISFVCMMTIFLIIALVNIYLTISTMIQSLLLGTKILMAIMTALSFITFVLYIIIFLALTLGLNLEKN
ncbi:MAG: hypothetical protein ACFFD2_12650 [Promethearchaeota archaeon]